MRNFILWVMFVFELKFHPKKIWKFENKKLMFRYLVTMLSPLGLIFFNSTFAKLAIYFFPLSHTSSHLGIFYKMKIKYFDFLKYCQWILNSFPNTTSKFSIFLVQKFETKRIQNLMAPVWQDAKNYFLDFKQNYLTLHLINFFKKILVLLVIKGKILQPNPLKCNFLSACIRNDTFEFFIYET